MTPNQIRTYLLSKGWIEHPKNRQLLSSPDLDTTVHLEQTPTEEPELHIDQFRDDEGNFLNSAGNPYNSDMEPWEFITEAILGWCGCGRSEEAMLYLRDVLRYIDSRNSIDYEAWDAAGEKVFGPKKKGHYGPSAMFAYYVLDEKGLTEHGSAVPGWLSDKGRKILEDLNKLNLDDA